MTRHRETAEEARLAGTLAVLRNAARQIANPPVRNMGTIGGSIAFADPAADYPPALVAADAEVEIAGASGRRRVAAEAFFVDWYATALGAGEIVTAVYLPAPRPGSGLYKKFARVAGDFAIASVAPPASSGRAGASPSARCGPTPLADDGADRALGDDRGDAASRGPRRCRGRADRLDDVRASADYRRRFIPRLLLRAVRAGLNRADE